MHVYFFIYFSFLINLLFDAIIWNIHNNKFLSRIIIFYIFFIIEIVIIIELQHFAIRVAICDNQKRANSWLHPNAIGNLTKGLANIIPILLSTAGSRCNITDTKQKDLLTNISTNQFLTNRVYNRNRYTEKRERKRECEKVTGKKKKEKIENTSNFSSLYSFLLFFDVLFSLTFLNNKRNVF